MKVEVCYADAQGATRIPLTLADDATVDDALVASDVFAHCGLDPAQLTFAVFGRRATRETPLIEGDRVELLRPLQVDPKEARRRRVAKKRSEG